jgi:hypothetical protein
VGDQSSASFSHNCGFCLSFFTVSPSQSLFVHTYHAHRHQSHANGAAQAALEAERARFAAEQRAREIEQEKLHLDTAAKIEAERAAREASAATERRLAEEKARVQAELEAERARFAAEQNRMLSEAAELDRARKEYEARMMADQVGAVLFIFYIAFVTCSSLRTCTRARVLSFKFKPASAFHSRCNVDWFPFAQHAIFNSLPRLFIAACANTLTETAIVGRTREANARRARRRTRAAAEAHVGAPARRRRR